MNRFRNAAVVICLSAGLAHALIGSFSFEKKISLPDGKNRIEFQHVLGPSTNDYHSYWIKAQANQKMSVTLKSDAEPGGPADVVFLVRGKAGNIMQGITKEGVKEWSGVLPSDDSYEIYIVNPPLDHRPVLKPENYDLSIQIK